MIQAHKGEKQLVELINILLGMNSDVFIHIDVKSENLYSRIKEKYSNNKQIFIIEDRVRVNWSGFSQVKATLKLMNAIRLSQRKYDYVHLISGQDFPIKSSKYISQFLSENYGKEFMEYRDINQHWWRLKCYNFFRENKKNRTLYMRILDNVIRRPQKYFIRRNNLKGFNLYFGSQWFTITNHCLNYILDYIEKNPGYLDEFKYTSCPDEHFFQILILNSPLKNNVVNNNLRYIDWSQGGNSPKTLTLDDWEDLQKSDQLFARKFDLKIDEKIIFKMEEKVNEGLFLLKNK